MQQRQTPWLIYSGTLSMKMLNSKTGNSDEQEDVVFQQQDFLALMLCVGGSGSTAGMSTVTVCCSFWDHIAQLGCHAPYLCHLKVHVCAKCHAGTAFNRLCTIPSSGRRGVIASGTMTALLYSSSIENYKRQLAANCLLVALIFVLCAARWPLRLCPHTSKRFSTMALKVSSARSAGVCYQCDTK